VLHYFYRNADVSEPVNAEAAPSHTTTSAGPSCSWWSMPTQHFQASAGCRCGSTAVTINCDRKLCKHECIFRGGCSLSGHGGDRPVRRSRSVGGFPPHRRSAWRRASAPPLTCATEGEEDRCYLQKLTRCYLEKCSTNTCLIKVQTVLSI